MADLRLKTADLTVGGRNYKVCCNMNVLADVQEMYSGKLGKGLADTSARGLIRWLTAMINDARDDLGEEPLTEKQVGKMLPASELAEMRKVLAGLLMSSLRAPEGEQEERGKNALTTQS